MGWFGRKDGHTINIRGVTKGGGVGCWAHRITGPGRRRIRQFGCHGGTPCIPKHVNPALRRPWIREIAVPLNEPDIFELRYILIDVVLELLARYGEMRLHNIHEASEID